MQTGAKMALLGLCMCAASSLCAAQGLGDLARQERARRAEQTRHAPIITNEDLKRERILPPAAPAAAPVAEAPSSASLPVSAKPGPNVPLWKVAEQPGFSLGNYARALRQEKKQREAEQSAKAAPRPEVDRGASALVRSVARPALADLPAVLRHSSPARSVKREIIVEHTAKASTPAPEPNKKVTARRPVRRARIVRTQEPDPSRVVVQPGDSLWRIAADVFGDGRLWTALWHANPGIVNPNRIFVGQTLRMPAAVQIATLRGKLQRAAAPAAQHTVRSGASAHQVPAPRSSAPAARLDARPSELPRP